MTSPRFEFGELLHAWRDRLSPADAGFAMTDGRRAPGLRREELAQLAGLSVDYIQRLERGRARNPSPQVVGALSRALQLSRTERDDFYRSAGLLPPRDGTIDTHVPPSMQRIAARLEAFPIGIFAADWSLVWWNGMWSALHGDPSLAPPTERNLARALFGTGFARASMRPFSSYHAEDALESSIVADLKEAISRYPKDRQLQSLVHDLTTTSDTFAHLWATSTVSRHTSNRKTILHPEVGAITLDCDVLLVPGADLRMVTYTAAAASGAARKLDLLRVTNGRTATAPLRSDRGHPAEGCEDRFQRRDPGTLL
ncbi:helix-turn-helix transcriptional regulator [Nocardia sp. NPDC051929]|uniref:helix-turn-helix transcriptional regulator n=1 Tax=unclassified Nocardia TaxID=2637762 RepID=UPI0034167859